MVIKTKLKFCQKIIHIQVFLITQSSNINLRIDRVPVITFLNVKFQPRSSVIFLRVTKGSACSCAV